MTARVASVNVGRPAPVPGRDEPSAIDKRPADHVLVRPPGPKRGGLGSGVVGDDVVSRRHHGGDRQAVYAVALEELAWWGRELGRDLPPGRFGENVTTEGLDVDGAIVGERWRVGDVVELEVCGPRIPCATFAAHLGEPHWVRRFTERGRTGAYLRVVVPGEIRAGDTVTVLARPDHGIDVPTTFRAFTGDRAAAERVLAARILGADDHADLERTLARRRTGP
jgi:MOSC domain-containing protein YiiM